MNKTVRQNNQLPNNLPQLQNVIKRDPKSYYDEFSLQYHHYKALMELFMLNPSSDSKDLEDLIMFLAQVSHCYPDEMSNFPNDLQDILRENASILNPDVRMTLCKALILMRNKNLIPPEKLLEFFFELFRCQDKLLRSTLYAHIVADIKRVNTPKRNNKINNMLQSFMFSMINDKSSIAVRMALDVMVELYHRNIWNDGKTVNVISNACFSTFPKVSMNAISFFLSDGMSGEEEAQGGSDDSNSEDESRTLRRMIVTKETCKGKKRKRKIDSALQLLKKKKKKRLQSSGNFSALYLINDPQDFAEKLFKKLESSREKFNVRLMLMNLISKLIGIHQLFILNFYSCLQRYLQPHQKDVTLLLSFFAQSCHQLIPPEIIETTVRAVADNFITERNSPEAICVGLNTIREVCSRCPLAISADLLQDLTQYQKYHNKNVVMGARSLINLYRSVNPVLLAKRDKGRVNGTNLVKEYGAMSAVDYVPGTELMDIHIDNNSDEEDNSSDGEEFKNESNNDGVIDVDKATHISQTRFLSQEEFEELRTEQTLNEIQPNKRRASLDNRSSNELVAVEDIEAMAKRRKMDKEARLASIKSGRCKGSLDINHYKKPHTNPNSSTNNKQKSKNKSFIMVKQKKDIRKKNKRSFRDKQNALRNSLLRKRKK